MEKTTIYDVEGQELVTTALTELLNQYPALEGREIKYSTIGESSGIAIFPTNGAAVREEKVNIIGIVKQTVEYPFIVIYRASGLSERGKERVKEWLDNLGRWLEKQDIKVGDELYHLDAYPELTRGRKFDKIARTSASYLNSINEAKAENWAINITATYKNEFKRR
jgi:hypothetical protein